MNKYFITESLGEVRKKTPEGYLLCVGVPIARTGEYEYGINELPDFEGREDGIIVCERPAEVVFADETVASFEGKPFVIGHPDEDVDVTNWSEHAVGVVQNVRKGEGDGNDLLVADILVTNEDAVSEIENGVREISCGYGGEYEQVEPGRIQLRRIVGNHVALVESGRAGHRVAIGDKAERAGKEGNAMTTKIGFLDWLKSSLKKAKDEGLIIEVGASGGEPSAPAAGDPPKDEGSFDAKTAFDALSAKMDALIESLKPADKADGAGEGGPDDLEDMLKDLIGESEGGGEPPKEPAADEGKAEDPPAADKKTGDAKPALKKTADVVPMADARSAMAFRSLAEILVPGYDCKSLTLDSPASVASSMRKVLSEACAKDSSVRRDVEEIYGSVIRSWSAVTDEEAKVLFGAAAKSKGQRNNEGAKVGVRDFAVVGGLDVPAIQDMHRQFWNKKEGK
jgi:hypothetical protein